jgi:hypothetical protein
LLSQGEKTCQSKTSILDEHIFGEKIIFAGVIYDTIKVSLNRNHFVDFSHRQLAELSLVWNRNDVQVPIWTLFELLAVIDTPNLKRFHIAFISMRKFGTEKLSLKPKQMDTSAIAY